MAKYSSADLIVKVDNSSGVLQALTGYVKTIGGFGPTVETAETTTFGSTWKTSQPHLKDGGEFTLEGDYDDTAATGPNAILNAIGDTRTVQIQWAGAGSGKPQSQMECHILKYERVASVGQLHGFVATLKVNGAVDETPQA